MMKYIFYKILSIILPTKASRKNYKNICNLIKKYKENNKVIFIDENGFKHLNPLKIKGLRISFLGNNNLITIQKPFYAKEFKISVNSNTHIYIGKNAHFDRNCEITKSNGDYLNKLVIGENFYCTGMSTFDLNEGGDIIIGNNNMFSWGINIKSDDTHSIFDKNTKELLNASDKIEIGDNVWVCMNAVILKNSKISSNSIVGANAVVSKKYLENNVIIAGNPARVCKKNVDWSGLSTKKYIEQKI